MFGDLEKVLGFGFMDEAKGGDEGGGAGGEDRGDGHEVIEEGKPDEKDEKDEKPDEKDEKDEKEKKEKEEKEEKKEEKRIPKSRFDQAVQKERAAREAAEKQAQELQAKLDSQTKDVKVEEIEAAIDALEEDLDKALADNNPAEKTRLRKEIRQMNQQLARAEATQMSRAATALAVEQIRYDSLVSQLEAAHPEINPDHESYDNDLAAEVIDLKEAYEAKGMSSTDALRKATKYVIREAAKAEAKGEEEGDDAEAQKKAADEAAKRKEEAIKKGLEAKGKQPPNAKGGTDSDKAGGGKEKNVNKMSQKDFDDLPEDELRRMRGDAV